MVVGAGLAGLNTARCLAAAGRDVLLLEAADAVGGRERTDRVDGFQLDRGFHVLNPAYPAVARAVDIGALDLRAFPVGVQVHRGRTLATLAHPLRHPALIPASIRSGLVRPRELIALARWAMPALVGPRTVIAAPDRALREGWDRARFHGALRSEVLAPFLAGVLADDDATSSDAFTRLLVRMFALGRPGLPTAGIAALPAALATRAADAGADIRTAARVARIRASVDRVEVSVAEGDAVAARHVVIAVSPESVGDLVPIPTPRMRGLQTWWFSPEDAPTSAFLRVDGTRGGPVVNTAVLSNTAASYAPPGRHLVHASCLLPAGSAAPAESEVRRQLSAVWRTDASSWPLLRRDDLPHALPAQQPPLRTHRRARIADRVFVAGDHRDTASIQGALASGERIARAVLREPRPSA